jgi:hypothetical protein
MCMCMCLHLRDKKKFTKSQRKKRSDVSSAFKYQFCCSCRTKRADSLVLLICMNLTWIANSHNDMVRSYSITKCKKTCTSPEYHLKPTMVQKVSKPTWYTLSWNSFSALEDSNALPSSQLAEGWLATCSIKQGS